MLTRKRTKILERVLDKWPLDPGCAHLNQCYFQECDSIGIVVYYYYYYCYHHHYQIIHHHYYY
jgi:hypothetical protein